MLDTLLRDQLAAVTLNKAHRSPTSPALEMNGPLTNKGKSIWAITNQRATKGAMCTELH